jgi:Lon protease-like protein
MASITDHKDGRFSIQFVGVDRVRRTVRLGKVTKDYAESFKGHVTHLLQAQITDEPLRRRTAEWVADLKEPIYKKLTRAGLLAGKRALMPSTSSKATARRRSAIAAGGTATSGRSSSASLSERG